MSAQKAHGRDPERLPIWPSIARILATLGIFAFHLLGLLGLNQHRLSMYALYTFAFLTGYLAQHRNVSRVRWVVKRYFSVMIPYWLIIPPVLAANWLAHYKPVSAASVLVTLLGGNLFLPNPVYVITWYVTFVLLLYVYLLIDSRFSGPGRLALAAAGYVVFRGWFGCGEYFVPFLAGMFIGGWMPPRPVTSRGEWARHGARATFWIQRLCYPFFLTHGGLQLALIRLTAWSPLAILLVSFVATVGAALVVDRLSESLLGIALGRLSHKQPSIDRAVVAV